MHTKLPFAVETPCCSGRPSRACHASCQVLSAGHVMLAARLRGGVASLGDDDNEGCPACLGFDHVSRHAFFCLCSSTSMTTEALLPSCVHPHVAPLTSCATCTTGTLYTSAGDCARCATLPDRHRSFCIQHASSGGRDGLTFGRPIR